MRWFTVRNARIDDGLRRHLEQLGVTVVQLMIANHQDNDWKLPIFQRWAKGMDMSIGAFSDKDVLSWLTEQYDRAERREAWLLTMEIAITVFVLGELSMSVLSIMKGH